MSQAASSETIIFARRMIGAGFRSVVVRNSTGVSRKIIENMRKNSDAPESSCGPLSSAETLIKSNAAAVEATIFLLSYRQLAIKPDEEIDVEAVIAAFDVYQDAHGAARGGKVDETVLLDINDAWVIARDYRSAELSEHYCGHCGISFFRPVRLAQKSCPLCQLLQVEDQPSAFDKSRNIAQVRDEALKMRNWGQSDDEIARSLGVSSADVRIPRHSDTQPTLIRTPVPRSFGQAVGAQRRRGGIVSLRCPASSISASVCALIHPPD